MKKALCILTALFAMSWASAQTSSSGQTSGSSDQSASSSSQATTKKGMKKGGGERTLTGCLNKEGDNYVLEHGKRKIQVTSSEDLSKHVGHTVKLHGMFEKAAATGEATGTEKGAKKGGAHEFKATSIDHVSDTCQAGAGMGEHKMNHHHKMGGMSGGGAASPSPSPSPQP